MGDAEAQELSREAQQQENRHLHFRYAEDGSLIIDARVLAEIGALVPKTLNAALSDAAEPTDTTDVPGGTSAAKVPVTARRVDALGVIAESLPPRQTVTNLRVTAASGSGWMRRMACRPHRLPFALFMSV
jgi:hypothetical protein